MRPVATGDELDTLSSVAWCSPNHEDRCVGSFIGRLIRGVRRDPIAPVQVAKVLGGDETLEVVGESFHQDALWKLVGGYTTEPVRVECRAALVPEPENPHDVNAIKVLIDGLLVGHLSREDAPAYLPGLRRLTMSHLGGAELRGVIVGGGRRGKGIGFLGVFLDHNPADFGLPPHYTTGGTLRTGLSEAMATDHADDSYDLSWLSTLDPVPEAAVAQLRALLMDEREPIDRHYMFCELEERLYHLRARPGALAEFDGVCSDHHAEMSLLRPALLNKFGAVPVIEMYRQAAIRSQKEREWQEVRAWAERGLEVYGRVAARQEAVADLQKRLALAAAKLEAVQLRESPARPARSRTASASSVAPIATLLCDSCGNAFDRARTRGRKPKLCPTCRNLTSTAAAH